LFSDDIILEACVGDVATSVKAQQNGAHQLELCGRLDLDGLTPDIELIQAVRNAVNIPIKVMLRNRGGDFVYSQSDIDEMKKSLPVLLEQDIQGIVFGALHQDGTINIELTNEICEMAGKLPVTFHKAIDVANNILEATISLKQTDIKEILTSGFFSSYFLSICVLRYVNLCCSIQKKYILSSSILFFSERSSVK